MQILNNFTESNIMEYLQAHHLIASSMTCDCGHSMNFQKRTDAADGVTWRCCKCKKRKSIRTGTFFEKSRLRLSTILEIMFDFVCELPVTTSMALNGIQSEAAVHWYENCRDVCSRLLLQQPQQLGGPQHEVQIDETLLFKRKNGVGHVVERIWVVGFYDNTVKRGSLVRVPDRSMQTLTEVIQNRVAPGSIIFTDQWASYRHLNSLNFFHFTVNHRTNFVNPATGVTTNNVEAFWSRIKRRLKYLYGSVGDQKWGHVDHCLYREWFHMKSEDVLNNWNLFLHHVSVAYPL